MSTDSHLFLDALEQMREILMSPDMSSRAQAAGLTEFIKDLFELMDTPKEVVEKYLKEREE